MATEAEGRTVLVTGATSGIGRATAKALIKAGYTVYGTSRSPEDAPDDPELRPMRLLPLDLTDEASIGRLVAALPPVDVLINNAGASQMSAVEETPVSKIKALYELLLFGPLRLTQGVLPGMRQRGRGLIVNIGSLSELSPIPCSSVYASAKAAVHVLSDGLRQEVAPFGIHVVTVAPTFVHTPIYQERMAAQGSAYAAMVRTAGRIRDRNIENGSPPEVIAAKILYILSLKRPASFYPAGKRAAALTAARRLVPERLRESILQRYFSPEKQKEVS